MNSTIRIALGSLVISCSFVLLGAAPQGPLGAGEDIAWTHAPYEVGACEICHEGSDPAAPGAITDPVNELCFGCHEDLQLMISDWENIHA